MTVSLQGAIFNRDATLDRVQGDIELLHDIVELFLDTSPGLLSKIRESIAHRDGKGLERAAHELKGAVGNFGARYALDCSLKLEQTGRSGDFSNAEKGYLQLEKEIGCLTQALAALKEETGL